MFEFQGVKIDWLGHDGFHILGSRRLYVDPYKIKGGEPADVVLITHEHFDHMSPEDIKKIATDKTVIVCADLCTSELKKLKVASVKGVKPGDEVTVEGVKVRAIPSYNLNKYRSPGQVFHPKSDGRVGFIFTLDNVTFYHAGDTDAIPEMAEVNVDVALLPVSGTYVMTAEEAIEAARRLRCKLAIPMHYGTIVGSKKDAELFKKKAPCPVEILERT